MNDQEHQADEAQPQPTKATAAVVAQRVEQVLRLLLHGARHADLCDYATAQAWNLSDCQIRRYQSKAYELARERNSEERATQLAIHQEARKAIIAQAMQTGDLRSALLAWKDLAELSGLYDAALNQRLEELERKVAERANGNATPARIASGT